MSWDLLIHGGASAWPELAEPGFADGAKAGLRAALAAGAAVLAAGGAATAAVEAAVRVLEDDVHFNAGHGAALTRAGTAELDACWHDGATGVVGAVAGVTRLRHPVSAARLVAERSGHVLMIGPGAEQFCLGAGAEQAQPTDFIIPRAQADLAAWQASTGGRFPRGTVGAVARDTQGRLAAATSTGGLTGKRPGRVGDCPLPGSGTWADHQCAVSSTGDGEGFIRAAFAHTVATLVAHGQHPEEATAAGLAAVRRQLPHADGGAIVLAADGRWSLAHCTPAMARGRISHDQPAVVAILGDEALA